MNGRISLILSIAAGIVTAVLPKLMLQQESRGDYPHYMRTFQSPWFITLMLFMGQSLQLLIIIYNNITPRGVRYQFMYTNYTFILQILTVSFFEVIISYCMIASLQWIRYSTWLVIRGIFPIFSFIRKALEYSQILEPNGAAGFIVMLISVGLVLTGEFIQNRSMNQLYSLLYLLVEQIAQTVQQWFEQRYLTDPNISDEILSGLIGAGSSLVMLVIFYPIVFFTSVYSPIFISENPYDTLLMIKNNYTLLLFMILYVFCACAYSYITSSMVDDFSKIKRSILIAMRLTGSYLIMLLATLVNTAWGETKDKYTFLSASGVFLYIISELMLDNSIRVCRKRPKAEVSSFSERELQFNTLY